MVDKINVEIPLDLAKDFVKRQDFTGKLEELVKAALPREYPDGTYAWVTVKGSASRRLVFRENGCWVTRKDGAPYVCDYEVVKVEPLQVAGEGEMVVPRPALTASIFNDAVNVLESRGLYATALFLRGVSRRM